VAVKLIREDVAGPLDLHARFHSEARAAASFSHPHVVRVYDFGVDRERRPFLVMELLEGQTLRQRLAGGQHVPGPEALEILRGVCSALSAAHAQGLVHRDLKPENIFLHRHAHDIVPKVLDFGLAKAFGEHWSLERPGPRLSSAGLLIGTFEYMAPEQVAGDQAEPAWDVWAASVIAYEMITGTPPFRRHVAFDRNDDVSGNEGAFGPAIGALSQSAAMLFRMALSTDRAVRPREALDFLAACERALA
jgi:serine/threonine-protein kinase